MSDNTKHASISFSDKTRNRTETYYKYLIENSHDIIVILDQYMVIRYVSPSVGKILGFQTHQLEGTRAINMVHPQDRDIVLSLMNANRINFEQAIQINIRCRHQDSSWRYMDCTAKNLLHIEAVNGVVINVRDVTDQVEMEDKLRNSELYFRSIIENSLSAISITDENGLRKYASPSMYPVFGYKPEELINISPVESVHPDEQERAREMVRELQANPNVPIKTEFTMKHASGKWIVAEVTGCNLMQNAAVKGIIFNAIDITDTKTAQEKLKVSEKYFRSLIENSNDMITICNERADFSYCSPSVERSLGYTMEEYLKLNGADLTHPSYYEKVGKVFGDVLSNPGKTFKEEYFFRHKNGKWVFLESIFHNLLHDAAVNGIVVISRDVSDRRVSEELLKNYNAQLEQEVNKKTKELQFKNEDLERLIKDLKNAQIQLIQSEKMASLGQLTAGIAHEINNPINFISSNVNPLKRNIESLKHILDMYEITEDLLSPEKVTEIKLLKNDLEFDYVLEETRQLLNGIEEGAFRTKEIVKGLRNFTRLDENDLKYASINSGIESTLMLLQNSFRDRIRIEKEYGNIPDIECYPGKLNQVFMNVLANAAQAIEAEGTIRITTKADNEFVTISISDSGMGMSGEVQNKIFEPFFTTKEVGEGTGLGLSITFGIIESHKGGIEVKSAPGAGSEFIITLPVKHNK